MFDSYFKEIELKKLFIAFIIGTVMYSITVVYCGIMHKLTLPILIALGLSYIVLMIMALFLIKEGV